MAPKGTTACHPATSQRSYGNVLKSSSSKTGLCTNSTMCGGQICRCETYTLGHTEVRGGCDISVHKTRTARRRYLCKDLLRKSREKSLWSRCPKYKSVVLWVHVLFLCFLSVHVNARDFKSELEPSKNLFDLEEGNDGLYNQDWVYGTPGLGDIGDENPVGGENLHLIAVVGHLFNRSLLQELKKFDSSLISDGDTIRVHFPTSYPGSKWLVFREESNLIQGVPLALHEGSHHIYIMVRHKDSSNGATTTLPCQVEVLTEENALRSTEDRENLPQQLCSSYEPVTVAKITLDTELSSMDELGRISCVQGLSNFLEVPCDRIKLHTLGDNNNKDRTFLAGGGNVAPKRTHRGERKVENTIMLSWAMGCSSDIVGEMPGISKLETSASDGSLAQATGHGITEWKVVNRIPEMKKIQRMRRQSGRHLKPSANPFHPRASKLDSNLRAIPGLETEETSETKIRRGRTRVQFGMIKATPMPGMHVPASSMITPPDRSNHMIASYTPTPPPKSTTTPTPPTPANDPPMILFGVTNIEAKYGTYVGYRVPKDAFYDSEDSGTRNLKLQVFDLETNEEVTNSGPWPYFDSDAQLLYGIPPEDAELEKEYLLQATDSGGKSSTIKFSIQIEDSPKPTPQNHKFTFYFTEKEEMKNMEEREIFTAFGRKLSVALAKPENDLPTLTMNKTGLVKSGGQRYISWFDNSFNNRYKCQSEETSQEAKLMIGVDAEQGKNKPAREFTAKFKPEFKLKSIKIELLGPCIRHTTTTIKSTTTTTPSTPDKIITTEGTETEEPPMIPSPPPQLPLITPKVSTSATTHKPSIDVLPNSTPVPPSSKPQPTVSPSVEKELPPIQTQVGKIVKYRIPMETFTDPMYPESDLMLKLVEWGDSIPPWVSLDSAQRAIYIMPTMEDYYQLEEFDSKHRVWKGGIRATNQEKGHSARALLEIRIAEGSGIEKMETNHKFEIKIKNYNMQNFTANHRARLIELICEIFGDETPTSMYIHPIKSGSVLFTWHNSTLSGKTPCPYSELSTLSEKIFSDREKMSDEVREKFMKSEFVVSALNLIKTDACVPGTPVSVPPKTTTTLATPKSAASSKSTTVIVIAVIIVCVIIIIVLVVIKCRMGKTTREKEKAKRQNQHPADKLDLTTSPKIAKGVPIIFQEEIPMDSNGNANAATPLMNESTPSSHYRGNGETKSPALASDDDNIMEETRLTETPQRQPMTPPTPIMSTRPPPPYVSPH